MNATEAKRKLCDIYRTLSDESQKQAVWIAIRAIDTCIGNGFEVTD